MATEKINEIFDIEAINKQVQAVKAGIESTLSDIEKFAKKASDLNKTIEQSGSFKEVADATDKVRKAQEEYAKQVDKLNGLKKQEQQLNERMNKAYQDMASKLAEMRKRADEEINALNERTKALKDNATQVQTNNTQKQNEIKLSKDNSNAVKNEAKSYMEMAESTKEVLLTRKNQISYLVTYQKTLKEVKKELSDLEKTEKRNGSLTAEQTAKKQKLIEKEFQYKQAVSNVSQVIKNDIKLSRTRTGSMNEMEQALGKMRMAYRKMSEEQRNSKFGQALQSQIQQTGDKLNKLNASIGNYQANVGNYGSVWGGVKDIFSKTMAVFAAGGVVLKTLGSIIKSTQTTGDEFNYTIAELKTSWELFKKSIASGDLYLFTRNMREAVRAGRELAMTLDEQFERSNSLKLRRAEESKELADLRDKLDDVNLSYKERQEAGEKYMKIIEGYYNEEIALNKSEAEARLKAFAAKAKADNETLEQTEQNILAFIKEYNITRDMIKQADEYTKAQERVAKTQAMLTKAEDPMSRKLITEELKKEQENFQKISAGTSDAVKEMAKVFKQYNLSTDEEITGIVESYVKLYQSEAAYQNENRRIQRSINTVTKEANAEQEKDSKKKQDDLEKYAKAEDKARREITIVGLNEEASTYKKTADDVSKSLEDRETALANYYEIQKQLAEQERDKSINKDSTESEVLLANKLYNNNVLKLDEQFEKDVNKLREDASKKRIEQIKKESIARETELQIEQEKELKAIAENYSNGNITTEEYNKERLDIVKKYQKAMFDAQISSLEEVANALPEEQRAEAFRNIELKRLEFERTIAEEEIKINANKNKTIEELEKILNDKRVQIALSAFSTITSIMSTASQNKIQEYDNEIDKIEEQKNKDIEAIEQMSVSEEEADARKKAIEARAEARKEKLEQKKKKEQRKQAAYEKANSVIQATISTSLAVLNALSTVHPYPAAVVAAALAAAMGAAQIATIVSQPLPKYAKGTEDHPGGLAIVGDGGQKEVAILPDGGYYVTPSIPTLVDLPKGTEVLPSVNEALMSITKAPRLDTSMPTSTDRIEKEIIELKSTMKSVITAIEKNRSQISVTLDQNGTWKVYDQKKGLDEYLNKNLRIQR